MFEYVCLSITSDCNMDCDYCYRIPAANRFMSENTFLNILRNLKSFGTIKINITGGEPLIHPKWREFVHICHDNQLVIVLSSNTLLLDLDDPILKYIEVLNIANDGFESELESRRSRAKDQFEKSLSIIEQYKKGNYPFKLKINTVVTKSNLEYIPEFGRLYIDHPGLIWMLFPYNNKGVYNRMLPEKIPSKQQWGALMHKLGSMNLRCNALLKHSDDISHDNSHYVIVNTDGDLFLSGFYDDYFIDNIDGFKGKDLKEKCLNKINNIIPNELYLDYVNPELAQPLVPVTVNKL